MAASLPGWDGTLPDPDNPIYAQHYQDFTVYSLNYLTQLSEKNPNPGDTYYIEGQKYDYKTSPGKIHDDVVVISGNTGEVNNNLDTCGGTAAGSGCDNAYAYPSPSAEYMTTSFTYGDPVVVVDGELVRSTWTAEQETLATFLGDGDLTFLFNLNEDNGGDANTLDGQALIISAKVDLTDADGNILVSFYLGANNAIPVAVVPCTAEDLWEGTAAGVGVCDGLAPLGQPEADPTNTAASGQLITDGAEVNDAPYLDEFYDPSMIVDTKLLDPLSTAGYIATDPRWAYVHGAISVDKTTGEFKAMGDCVYTELANCKTVNQNLGAKDAAFAALNLELSDLIKAGCWTSLAGACIDIAFMNVDVLISGQSNGFEQMLIIATNVDDFERVSEPGTLAIIALGLLTLGIRKRRMPARRAS